MCGITGFISHDYCEAPDLQARVQAMADQLSHRGPDDSGTWADAAAGVALGFRRLSIVDLSPAGHQPMESASGRFVIAFNGEVYNFLELRSELESLNYAFRGHSDTEVMLGAITEWGLERAVRKFVGMFALALWDRQEQAFHLVRDRIGIKPLYYGWAGNTFLFGSELKALRANSAFASEIDRNALALFFRHQYIPQPYSIYKGIEKLCPGCILTVKRSDALSRTHHVRSYWSAKEVAERGVADVFRGTATEAVDELDQLLRSAVRLRMVADVPLGAFLSGGIDSSTVVSLMQTQANKPVKTFTIGFHEDKYNEARHAKQIAEHLGTNHTELYLTAEQTLDVIGRLPALYDEPFADSSQIPTFLVSGLARQQVTVSLSGDGGDELFGGYDRYFLGQSIWRSVGWLPHRVRHSASSTLKRVDPDSWSRLFNLMKPLLPARFAAELRGKRVHTIADMFEAKNQNYFYRQLLSCWKKPAELVIGATEPETAFTDVHQQANLPSFLQRMMFSDLVTYLPDCILTKVDRASMAVSLEARVPLLDHRVVEFAARIPLNMKIRSGKGKWILRQLLYRYVPRELVERRKMGFGIPLGAWLRGPLQGWAEDLLDDRQMQQDGYLRPEPVRKMWADHLAGDRDWGSYLWTVLMFQSWMRHWMRGDVRKPRTSQLVLQ
jgi:asparagine synthase (glutamine-hydrolysing)